MLVVLPFRSIVRRPTVHLSVPPNETSFCPLERDVLVSPCARPRAKKKNEPERSSGQEDSSLFLGRSSTGSGF